MKFRIAEYRVVTRRLQVTVPQPATGVMQPARGLGDTVAQITHATGIAQAVHKVEALTGWQCWCPQVQAWLNAHFPYPRERLKAAKKG